jgi:catechol 2,3-dioxygenase-like lactoylglutathione lyase family enzyme
MLHHVSVGVSDVGRAAQFYDAALGALGYKRVMEFMPYAIGYGTRSPVLWVQIPNDRNAASVGNGVHIALNAATKNAVHAFHRAALEAGGTDDGQPGPRAEYSPDYYGAFVRDLDGNKIEAVLVKMSVKGKSKPKKMAANRAKKPAKRSAKKSAKKARKSKRR